MSVFVDTIKTRIAMVRENRKRERHLLKRGYKRRDGSNDLTRPLQRVTLSKGVNASLSTRYESLRGNEQGPHSMEPWTARAIWPRFERIDVYDQFGRLRDTLRIDWYGDHKA